MHSDITYVYMYNSIYYINLKKPKRHAIWSDGGTREGLNAYQSLQDFSNYQKNYNEAIVTLCHPNNLQGVHILFWVIQNRLKGIPK
jgi:hypothetical protein